jgi:hypothetical protein
MPSLADRRTVSDDEATVAAGQTCNLKCCYAYYGKKVFETLKKGSMMKMS